MASRWSRRRATLLLPLTAKRVLSPVMSRGWRSRSPNRERRGRQARRDPKVILARLDRKGRKEQLAQPAHKARRAIQARQERKGHKDRKVILERQGHKVPPAQQERKDRQVR